VDNEAWKPLVGQVLVVDTNSSWIYLGTLARVEDHFIVLTQADVHDRNESPSTKEQYIMDAKRFGVKPNRREVSVRKSQVVSASKLEDVITY
jgi:hypothetical protein